MVQRFRIRHSPKSPNLGTSGYKTCPTTWAEYEKSVINTSSGVTLDAHCWVEDKNGVISDYEEDDPVYKSIRFTNNLYGERKYHKLIGEERKKAWSFVFKKSIKPRLKIFCEMDKDEKFNLIQYYYNSSGNCFMRAYFISLTDDEATPLDVENLINKIISYSNYKDIIKLPMLQKIQIGYMGWENKKNNKIWWEFG